MTKQPQTTPDLEDWFIDWAKDQTTKCREALASYKAAVVPLDILCLPANEERHLGFLPYYKKGEGGFYQMSIKEINLVREAK